MEYSKFILCGEDKRLLGAVKDILNSAGHTFLGYSSEPFKILRHIRRMMPDLVIMEVNNNFGELKQVLEVVDEELLSACILLLNARSDEVYDFIRKTRVMAYILKPVFDDALLQMADISLANFGRILEYEKRVQKLNNSLESRKIVEKAKWLMIEQEGMTENEAYEIIKKKSRDNRMPMRDIAEAIILTRNGI